MGNATQSLHPIGDGIELNISGAGSLGRLCCILLHGLADGAFIWRELMRDLSNDFRVLAIDLRGHGDSQHSSISNYTFAAYCNDVRMLVSQIAKKSPYVLIGHSLGGDIAAYLASLHPPGLAASVLIDAGPPSSEDDDVRAVLYNRIVGGHRAYETVDEYVHWLKEGRGLTEDRILQQIGRDSLRIDPTGYHPKLDISVAKILLEKLDLSWWSPALRDVRVPTLVMRGKYSAALTKSCFQRMISELPLGTGVVIEGAGHSVITDNPPSSYQVIRSFLLPLVQQYKRTERDS